MRGLGTVINLAAVAIGGTTGVIVGERLPERLRTTIMQALGLVVIAVGVVGLRPLYSADRGLRRFIILIIAMILGGIVGETLRLEDRFESFAARIRSRFKRASSDDEANESFVDGFVIASTLFCVGPITIVGAIEDGLGISIRLLTIKSALDGTAAVGLASVYGWGVLASLITIAVYQGGVTLGAAALRPLMTAEVVAQLGATGSLLVIGIGLRLLGVVRVRLINLLPAIAVAGAAAALIR
jgi:uncharacterized membrane protein YqgA involved in biofilm formation